MPLHYEKLPGLQWIPRLKKEKGGQIDHPFILNLYGLITEYRYPE
jgi:hypothetical protein